MLIQEDLKGVTYVVAGALEHADNLGNRGVLTAGRVHPRWLGWGAEHEEWNPSPFAPTEFIQLWLETAQPYPTSDVNGTRNLSNPLRIRVLVVPSGACRVAATS